MYVKLLATTAAWALKQENIPAWYEVRAYCISECPQVSRASINPSYAEMAWKAILYIIKISFVAHWRKVHISQHLIYQWLLLLTCFLFLTLSLSPSHRGFPASVRTTCVLVYLEWSPGWEQTVGFVCGTINQLSFNKNRKPDERQREESWGVGSYFGRKKDRGWGEKVERRVREKGVWPRSWTLINQTATITSKVFMWLDWLIRHFQARGGWVSSLRLLLLSHQCCGRLLNESLSHFMLLSMLLCFKLEAFSGG